MDHSLARERESRCIQEQPPACTAACPVHVDVRGMIREIRSNNFSAAFTLFSRTIPFPRIISCICDQPCQTACRRAEAGDAIQIRALEHACTEYGGSPPRRPRHLVQKNQRIAIVGAGLSGLTAAVDLAHKGYKVVLFEAGNQAGGRLRQFSARELPQSALVTDLAILPALGIELCCNTTVGAASGELLADYDAVLLATGLDRQAAACMPPHMNVFDCFQPVEQAYSPINSLLRGRTAATTIDRFLQQVSLTAGREAEGAYQSKLYTNVLQVEPTAAVPLTGQFGYLAQEAVKEAERCLQCECLECVKQCEFLAHYGSYPKRYVREIYNNDSIVMGIRHSNKMINSCTLCGLCAKVCPVDFNMGQICHEARQSLVHKGKMPPSAHEFALRDLEFSNGPDFFLARSHPEQATCKFLFFPGCQLCASSPDYVIRMYEYIREKTGSAGVMLGCCGAPANWAGRQELFAATLEKLAAEWRNLGSPCLITACSTCYREFREHLPTIPVESLWNWLDREGLPPGVQAPTGPVAIHDPCTTRDYPHIQNSIRSLLGKLGVLSEELPLHGDLTTCCGFGGLVSFANPPLAAKMVDRRVGESSADYLAYCAMCRDNLARTGKQVYHILDFLYGDTQTVCIDRKVPDYSERRINRIWLKKRLLNAVWHEPPATDSQEPRLIFADSVRNKMERRMILSDDVAQVINFYATTGSAFSLAETGRLITHCRLGNVTYWVEFLPAEDGYHIENVYSHRMILTETAVCGETAAAKQSQSGLVCQKCEVPLALGKVTVAYMDSAFPVELLKCHHCGAVYVPEELAVGKMLEVEKALEDK